MSRILALVFTVLTVARAFAASPRMPWPNENLDGGFPLPAPPAQPITGMIYAPQYGQPQDPNANQDNSQALSALSQMLSQMGGGGSHRRAKIPADADHDTYPNDSEGPSGTTDIGDMSTPPSAGQCGSAQNLWEATGNVMNKGVIPAGSGYNMGAANWPKLRKQGNTYVVDFGPGKQSMCTAATAAAFYQHLADLANRGELDLSTQEINWLNTSPVAHNAFNGNTYSAAIFIDYLGGRSVMGTRGDSGSIMKALSQAKPGDILKFDRASGTGHSTIFKDIENGKFCYWSSNTRTNGPGVQCESISSLTDVSVSRFPADPKEIPAKLDSMMSNGSLSHYLSSGNGTIPAKAAGFVEQLDCPPTAVASPAAGDGKAGK